VVGNLQPSNRRRTSLKDERTEQRDFWIHA
jgi:hypothetical protein